MRDLSQILDNLPVPLPGLEASATGASHPVWRDSASEEVDFQPMRRGARWKLWCDAQKFDRQGHQRGCHGGLIGVYPLRVLYVMLFNFLHCETGRLDPSIKTIAKAAGMSEHAAGDALKRLRDTGILARRRRCKPSWREGRHVLEQLTNAYFLRPVAEWLGFRAPPTAPAPHRDTWGAAPRVPSVLDQAAAEVAAGSGLRSTVAALTLAPLNTLEAALARLGRRVEEAKTAKA